MADGARFWGIDLGAETIKAVELVEDGAGLRRGRTAAVEHHERPGPALLALLETWGLGGDEAAVAGAAVCGRLARLVRLPRVPIQRALARGFRFAYGDEPATVASIGAHGFSVLELRGAGVEVFRENSRCSQGTGNFLRQLVGRFGLSIEEASALSDGVADPAVLSGRCPVILKTDVTHLANKGEPRERILAGLFDAVSENVEVLVKPGASPPRVALAGGVSRSARVREHFRRFVEGREMTLLPWSEENAVYHEATGCALVAAERPLGMPSLREILAPPEEARLERVPALAAHLDHVERMPRRPFPSVGAAPRDAILGLDIGSTGSKAVALDARTREALWEGYVGTRGDPVGAAQQLVRDFAGGPAGRSSVRAFGVTGSGREIVGSLLATCYGVERVFILNEIAAHAEGARFYDPRVDTIFEIGGQDAKYVRLAGGRVVDAAMNEACSAGTGSFIEEQGRKFSGIRDVSHLGEEALRADACISLGQHCSVFMAEVIDGAVAAGAETPSIIAGIYDSIVQNYLNRVKGSRPVGEVVFCQGMPFSSGALAAAVARQTGSRVIVPPSPGTVGALGIALLGLGAIAAEPGPAVDLRRFLDARVAAKETFICKASKGCGGTGNRCRIDRLATVVDGKPGRFTWGGGCSLWDRGTGKRKLPDLAPDPFRAREEAMEALLARLRERAGGGRRIALTDGFQLKGLFPFFATFLTDLGFTLEIDRGAGHATLKRGIERANVPYCAPMQFYHGLAQAMATRRADVILLPMLRSFPRVADEPSAIACPIVQASPEILRWDLGAEARPTIVSPVIDFGPGGLASPEVGDGLRRTAAALGVEGDAWRRAWDRARAEQEAFDRHCLDLGREALAFCRAHDVVPVVVLGRPYTIYNTVLNSNVPALLREQGAIAIPTDCYPVAPDVPTFPDFYWAWGQRNLRAAWQVRREPGLYTLWCSNYACGPDSFNLHFYARLMEGKPFAIIETDGHSGDAGTKTRVEAFLHCVREDQRAGTHRRAACEREPAGAPVAEASGVTEGCRRDGRVSGTIAAPSAAPCASLRNAERDHVGIEDLRRQRERVLIPRMSAGAEALAACLRGMGVAAETLPEPDRETVRVGRRYTSGKECVPMVITLGSLLQRLERSSDPAERFAFVMPTARGPCRFGVYHVLHKMVLERLGWRDRVRVWSPTDGDYFAGLPAGFSALVFTGFAAFDALDVARLDVRPVEARRGAAREIYDRAIAAVVRELEERARRPRSVAGVLAEVFAGDLFGIAPILARAASELQAVRTAEPRPSVAMVGELYVRLDPFANDFVANRLADRGVKVRLAPFVEWVEYVDLLNRTRGPKGGFGAWLSSKVRGRIQDRVHRAFAGPLGWPERTTVRETLDAAAPYVRRELEGEAVLTVGGPVHEWRHGFIDGVVSVGPLECMPNKIAEAQFHHAAESEGLPSLTISLNGDPLDDSVVDAFAFDVWERFRARSEGRPAPAPRRAPVPAPAHPTPAPAPTAADLAGR